MITRLAALLSILTGLLLPQATGEVLIVADEFPAMEVLVKRLKVEANSAAAIVDQARLPKSLNEFRGRSRLHPQGARSRGRARVH